MKSLYQISEELQDIINNIEDNGGEVTENIMNTLTISQNELREKAQSYCNVINMLNGDIDACKAEKKRINDLQNTRKNTVDKLKSVLLDALNKFGDEGKSGNKVLDTQLYKLFTKSTKSISVNEERLNTFAYYVISYMSELKSNGILSLGEDIDYTGMVNAINAVIKANRGEEYESFTVQDLLSLNFNVNLSIPIGRIIFEKNQALIDVLIDNAALVTNDITDSSKELIKGGDDRFTIANLETKQSLTIK